LEILVTGSRDFTDYAKMKAAMKNLDPEKITRVIHGAAPGADSLASRWAYEKGVDVLAYGAKWGKYGRAAGAIRNSKMLRLHPDALVFAFPLPNSRGTVDCINKARKKGMRVVVIS